MVYKRLTVLILVLSCSLSVAAQAAKPTYELGNDKTARGSIKGHVLTPAGPAVTQSVRVTLLTVTGVQATAYTDNQGSFEFPQLNPGNYEVQVEAGGIQLEVVSQNVQVFRGAPSIITISLREPESSKKRPDGRASVSVGELSNDIPKSARKEFQLASRAAQENKSDEAIAHLRKAIDLYPNFLMARNDLGTQLLAQGKLDEAAEELRQAILIDDKSFNPKLNLGIVLVQQHKFVEAAEILDRALSLDSESPSAQLYSGEAQLGLGNYSRAEKELRAAYSIGGRPFSLALFHLGQLYMSKGDRDLAQRAFQLYLHEVPDAANADQVRKLIAMLH